MNNLSIERLKDFERDPLNNFLTRSEMMQVVKDLIAIRELKGDQVPVGWIKSSPNEAVSWDSVDPIYLAGSNAPVGWRSDYKPVYNRPQKPVVLLPKFTDRHTCMNAGCDAAAAYKEDVIAMNKAASGIVKDGE